MISSRKIEDLTPEAQAKCKAFIESCKSSGIDILITSTYRDDESQNALYAQGRTAPGKIVTNAKGGQSFHNYQIAFDFVPLVNGKPAWDDLDLIKKCGEIGKKCGLSWAGDWKSFKEMLHFQLPGYTLADLQKRSAK